MTPGEQEAATEETDRAEMAGEEARLGPEAARVTRARVALVGCGAQKASRTCAAQSMYTSPLFRASLRWALLHCDRVFILSAKHGLLGLDDVIEPYDQQLPRDKAGRAAWGQRVAAQLDAALPDLDTELVVLAGERYADAIEPADRDWLWSEPLRGMQIGQRLAWLKAQHEAESAEEAPTPPLLCRTPSREEQERFAREFPEFVVAMPGGGA